jgi:hypothetical protein
MASMWDCVDYYIFCCGERGREEEREKEGEK